MQVLAHQPLASKLKVGPPQCPSHSTSSRTLYIPMHIHVPNTSLPDDRRAFEFLEAPSRDAARAGPLPEDGKLLVDFNKALIATGVLPPPRTATRRG